MLLSASSVTNSSVAQFGSAAAHCSPPLLPFRSPSGHAATGKTNRGPSPLRCRPDPTADEKLCGGRRRWITGSWERRRHRRERGARRGLLLARRTRSRSAETRRPYRGMAGAVLGHEPETSPLASVATGTALAFTSGLAGTFTACNIAVFGTVAPMLGTVGTVEVLPLDQWAVGGDADDQQERAVEDHVSLAADPGTVPVVTQAPAAQVPAPERDADGGARTPICAVRPALDVIGGQSGRDVACPGQPPVRWEEAQSCGVIGLSMFWLGLSALGYAPDPFAKSARRFPHAPDGVHGRPGRRLPHRAAVSALA